MSERGHPAVQQYAAHVSPSYVKVLGALGHGRVFARARGTRLWDSDGREYLDFASANGVASLGHNHPAIRETLRQALDEDSPGLAHSGIPVDAAELATELARLVAPLDRCLFATTGSEAVDVALKLARMATKRKAIVYTTGGVHGTSLGALSITGDGRLRDPVEPLLGECYAVPFDDLDALERALSTRKTAAFVVEPMQVEAGVVHPSRGYLRAARELAQKHGALFVLDEAHTGLGRTGAMFTYEEEGFLPDVLLIGEALGGGFVPIAAAMTTAEIHDRAYGRVDRYDFHRTSFGGYTLGARVARTTLAVLARDELASRSKERGDLLRERLRDELADHPFVRGVRGRGLLVGIELGPPPKARSKRLLGRIFPSLLTAVGTRVFGQWLAVRLLERGILCQPASQQWNVLKLEPALTVSEAEIERVVDAISEILGQYREVRPLLQDVGQRLGSQLLSGWSF